jgi:hypothetical protein
MAISPALPMRTPSRSRQDQGQASDKYQQRDAQ